MCEHVYKYMGAEICPKCDGPTHEPDWSAITKAHKEFKDANPGFKYVWWSI